MRVAPRQMIEALGIGVFGLLSGAFVMSLFMPQDETTPPRPIIAEPSGIDRSTIRVEVRNGSGRSGAAREVTSRLRDDGFDVVDFGNADHFSYPATLVIDRVGRPSLAAEVAGSFGIATPVLEPDSSLLLDVTVILGRDRIWATDTADPDRSSPVQRWWRRLTTR